MKKIVGIIAALAMASAVFAADISAKVELDGNFFKYDGASKAISALNVDKPGDQHWNPVFSASVSGDNAGASFCVFSGNKVDGTGLITGVDLTDPAKPDLKTTSLFGWNNGKALAGRNWQIWMSPADGLKFTIGKIDTNLNQEQITWSGTKLNIDSNGFGVNFGLDALSIDLFFTPDLGNNWMSKPDGGDMAIGDTALKLSYGADFGNIGFLYKAANTFKTNTIALGYSNNFDAVFAFLNVGATFADGADMALRVEAFAKGSADAFGWAVWVPFDYQAKAAVGAIVELTYALDGATAYFRFNDGNFLGDAFAAEFRLGAKGSVGGAGWNIWAQIDAGSATSFSVPFELSYGF